MERYTSVKGRGLAFLLLLWSLWFFIMLVRTILGPILPLIEDEFVISHSKAAILVSCCALGASSSIFASGVFAGRFGYKRSALLSLAVSIAAFLVVPYAKAFSQVAGLMFVLGVATGAYFPCIIPLVTEHFMPPIWGRALAIQDTGASFSLFGAPLLTILLLKFLPWRHFYSVFAAAYFVSGTLFLLFAKEVKVTKKLNSYFGELFKKPPLWIISILWTIATGASMGIYQVIPLYLTKELSFTTQYANLLFGLSRLGGVMFSIVMGFSADRFDPKRSMFLALFLAGIFTILIAQKNLVVVQIALFLQGTVIMGVFSLGLVAISRMFKMEERSLVSGTMSTMSGVFGFALLPYLLGLAGDYLSFRLGILFFGLVVILSSGLVLLLKIPWTNQRPKGFGEAR
jgi:MFS transporter, YNFM family, putative membrane transport protein